MVTFAEVRELALALPSAEEGTSYGTPAFKVRGTLFARLREEGDVLVVKVDSDYRDALVRSAPDTYFITPHYEKSPMVLMRLSNVNREELGELLTDSWRISAPKRLVATFNAEAEMRPPPGPLPMRRG